LPSIKKRENQEKYHLTVHLVPHTHDDVGWDKTVDEYFTGAAPNRQLASVATILDTVISELQRNPKRRFTYVEMKFFHMWYTQQEKGVKDEVKRLIKNGQLEITQGGWSATDEACPSYEDLIVNMHIGHQFLWEEFGIKPRIGWMVDPFGHSQGNAAVFADFGFEALFFSRMNYDMRRRFWKEKKMTFMWEPFSDNHGRNK
jgi:lysosomal alpha-mannosidase